MKKLIAFIALVLFSAPAFAEFGFGIKGGYAQNTESVVENSGFKKKQDVPVFAGIEFLFQEYISESFMLGIKVGAEASYPGKYTGPTASMVMPGMPPTIMRVDYKLDTLALKLPVTVYLKYDFPDPRFNLWAGAGATYGYVSRNHEVETAIYSIGGALIHRSSAKQDSDGDKIFPHIKGGFEYRPVDAFGIGLDLGYNFNAKVNDKTAVTQYTDMTGFEASLAARFYF